MKQIDFSNKMVTNFIQWSDEMSVGIEELDEHHKVLVNLINDLYHAIQNRHSNKITQEILVRLAEYTRIHFAVEESLMRIFDYPDYEKHKKEHEELIRNVTDLSNRFEIGKANVSFSLMHFLKTWLTKHIMESDKRYTDYFLKSGVKPVLKKRSWIMSLWQ